MDRRSSVCTQHGFCIISDKMFSPVSQKLGQKLSKTIAVQSRSLSISGVPVTQVATYMKLNVKDEPTAAAMDDLMDHALSDYLKKSPGYLKSSRTVCKSEWAYEIAHVWKDAETYGAWKESDLRTDLMKDIAPKIAGLGIDMEKDIYWGARVYDERTP